MSAQKKTVAMEHNKLGNTALALVVSGWIAAFINFYPPLLTIGSILCPLGLIFGLIAVRREPRETASWAVGLGVLGLIAFVGTIWSRVLMFI